MDVKVFNPKSFMDGIGQKAMCLQQTGMSNAMLIRSGECYGISRAALKGGNGSTGGMPVEKEKMPSITANGCGAVCYAVYASIGSG